MDKNKNSLIQRSHLLGNMLVLIIATLLTSCNANSGSNLPILEGDVIIVGNPVSGSTLTADVVVNSDGALEYQWKQCDTESDAGKNVGTRRTYTVKDDDMDKYIKVVVTSQGYSRSITSDAVYIPMVSRINSEEEARGFLRWLTLTMYSIYSRLSYDFESPTIVNGDESGFVNVDGEKYESRIGTWPNWTNRYRGDFSVNFNNFSTYSSMTILSGSGHYVYGYTQQNTSTNTFYTYYISITLNSCPILWEFESKNYQESVSIEYEFNRYYRLEGSNSNYWGSFEATIVLSDGRTFTLSGNGEY